MSFPGLHRRTNKTVGWRAKGSRVPPKKKNYEFLNHLQFNRRDERAREEREREKDYRQRNHARRDRDGRRHGGRPAGTPGTHAGPRRTEPRLAAYLPGAPPAPAARAPHGHVATVAPPLSSVTCRAASEKKKTGKNRTTDNWTQQSERDKKINLKKLRRNARAASRAKCREPYRT